MIEDGLFELFPVDAIYGMHNIPGIEVGEFAIRSGPMMAAFDIFKVTVNGRGSHAAVPHHSINPIIIGAKIVEAYQTIVSRMADPQEPAVVSVTQFHGGDAYNVIADTVEISGCTRCFSTSLQDFFESQLQTIAEGIASAFGATVSFHYERRYPPTVNSVVETDAAAQAAITVVGKENVNLNPTPAMGSEDFAYMLLEKPGSYIWIGNGRGEGSCMVHNVGYDFNDEILPIGASYWAQLVESQLPIVT